MTVYLDDDSIAHELQRQLLNAGHQLVLPAHFGLSGHDDVEHMIYTVAHHLPILTRNFGDFLQLHNLVQACGGHHPGILVVRRDDDYRDMKPHQIVIALTKMNRAHPTCTDLYVILNHWR